MKFCSQCGKELDDSAAFCDACGASIDKPQEITSSSNKNNLYIAAKVFMIISTVISGFCILPLLWTIPMTISFCKKLNRNEKIGIGFKICCLLFVSTIAGVLMLFVNEDKKTF